MFVKLGDVRPVNNTDRDLKSEILKVVELIADKLGLEYYYEDITVEERTYRQTDILEKFKVTFKNGPDVKYTFHIEIPYLEGIIEIKGHQRYIQKQIRDTLFIPSVKKVLIGDLIFSFFTHSWNLGFNRIGIPLYPLYKYYAEREGKENILLPLVDKYPKLKEQSKHTLKKSVAKSKLDAFTFALETIYEIYKPLLSDYVDSISDLLLKIFFNAIDPINLHQDETGLNLLHRRVRKADQIVFDGYVTQIINFFVHNMINRSRTKSKLLKLEPTQHLFSFVIMEQFIAPLATMADMNRVTILGPGGFSRDSVPPKVRDIHPTMMYNIDPCVTPDRDNAGVVQYLSTNVDLDEHGRFINLLDEELQMFKQYYDQCFDKLKSGKYSELYQEDVNV